MKRTTIAALAAVLLLSLTGCAGAADNGSGDRIAPNVSESAAPGSEPTETAAPLTAETAAPDANTPDAKFLAYVRETVLPETQIGNATDEQLIAAGHEACAQLASGVALEDVRVVEGETPHPSTGGYYDTSAIMGGAILNYCPEFS